MTKTVSQIEFSISFKKNYLDLPVTKQTSYIEHLDKSWENMYKITM